MNRGAKLIILIICTLAVIGTAGYLLVDLNAGPDAPVAILTDRLHDFGLVDPSYVLESCLRVEGTFDGLNLMGEDWS